MRVRHIVFYGTLRRGHPKHAELGLPRALRYIGPRAVRGALFELGEYPGLVAGDDTVEVELYEIRDDSVLERLDRYEGFDPTRPAESPFVRETIHVRRLAHSGGLECLAWVYRFNGPVPVHGRSS